MLPLFDLYPRLCDRLPYVKLCDLPTPVERLETASDTLGLNLFIKRDDQTAASYGGNKPRRLELMLGQALARGHRQVVTFGYAGSNHALATAIHAQRIGLETLLILLEQPNAHYVRRNLAAHYSAGAELHHYRSELFAYLGGVPQLIRHTLSHRRNPYWIPAGGTSPLGTVGYVNAALEFKQQLEAGLLPAPSRVYVALGSMGTAIGLVIGFKAAGLKIPVVGIDIVGRPWASAEGAAKLFQQTTALLTAADPSFPKLEYEPGDLIIREEFLGPAYAHFTPAGMEAVQFLAKQEGLNLDGSYTGKTFAALLADVRAGQLAGQDVLYWHTYNSRPLAELPGNDYGLLPRPFHRYFEQPVQPLDREQTQVSETASPS